MRDPIRPVPAVALLLALLVGALAGCSQEPEATPVKQTPKLSQEEFLSRGNEICRRSSAELERRKSKVDTSTPAKARRAVRSVIVPNLREQVAELRGLRGPARLEKQLTPVLDDADRLLDFIDEDPSRLADNDLIFQQVDDGLAALGLTDCTA